MPSPSTSLTIAASTAVDKAPVHRLVSVGWNSELHAGLARDSGVFRVVCPFVKERVLGELLDQHAREDVLLITRFRLADFYAGVSDIAALRRVRAAGGSVRGVSGLHAKVYLFGGSRAAVTSANLTSRACTGTMSSGKPQRTGGNINPRKAFMQQASVRLTDEAAVWLTSRLRAAFAIHGRIPASDLAELDCPEAP